MFAKIRVFVASLLMELAIRLASLNLLLATHKKPPSFPPSQTPVEDKPPLTTPQKDYQAILQELAQQGKPSSKVAHRKPIPKDLCCPDCGAPSDYIYSFGTKKGQQKFRCTLCLRQWGQNNPKPSPNLYCPFWGYALQPSHYFSTHTIYKCRYKECPYREKREKFLQDQHLRPSKTFPLRYTHYQFHLALEELKLAAPQTKVDLTKIHHSEGTLALTASLYVEAGLSLRQTTHVLKILFGIDISHQTVDNWMKALASMLYPLTRIDSEAELIVTDGTQITIAGKQGYFYPVYDPQTHQIILFHMAQSKSAKEQIVTLYYASKTAPFAQVLVTDGDPAYVAAIRFLDEQQITLPKHIVIKGLKSTGEPEDEQYRKFKNYIERLMRTFKGQYQRTTGFKSFEGALAFITLFCVYYNYLRPHSKCEGRPPVDLGLEGLTPTHRWRRLIQLAAEKANSE